MRSQAALHPDAKKELRRTGTSVNFYNHYALFLAKGALKRRAVPLWQNHNPRFQHPTVFVRRMVRLSFKATNDETKAKIF